MLGKLDYRKIGEYIAEVISGFAPFNLAELYSGPKIDLNSEDELTPQQEDARAIASDWKKVGENLESMIPYHSIFTKRRIT